MQLLLRARKNAHVRLQLWQQSCLSMLRPAATEAHVCQLKIALLKKVKERCQRMHFSSGLHPCSAPVHLDSELVDETEGASVMCEHICSERVLAALAVHLEHIHAFVAQPQAQARHACDKPRAADARRVGRDVVEGHARVQGGVVRNSRVGSKAVGAPGVSYRCVKRVIAGDACNTKYVVSRLTQERGGARSPNE